MTNLMKMIAAAGCLVAVHATASAELFHFSKMTDTGKVLAKFAVYLGTDRDDVASFSDMHKTHLQTCTSSTNTKTGAQSDVEARPPARAPDVNLGTLLTVRRSEDENAYIASIFESRATPAGCIPLVSGSRFIAEVRVVAGGRTKVAAQLESDGTRAIWWLEREQAVDAGDRGAVQ